MAALLDSVARAAPQLAHLLKAQRELANAELNPAAVLRLALAEQEEEWPELHECKEALRNGGTANESTGTMEEPEHDRSNWKIEPQRTGSLTQIARAVERTTAGEKCHTVETGDQSRMSDVLSGTKKLLRQPTLFTRYASGTRLRRY
jgi:hypothetical protein